MCYVTRGPSSRTIQKIQRISLKILHISQNREPFPHSVKTLHILSELLMRSVEHLSLEWYC